jgi:hypothetical protein
MGDKPYKYCNLQWEIIHTLLSCVSIFFVHVYIRGGSRRGRTRRAPPPKIGKILILWRKIVILGYQVRGGAHLKKLRRAEGGAKIVGVFRVKNHDFTPKNHIFSKILGCSRKVSCSCSTSVTRRVNLITNPVIVHE